MAVSLKQLLHHGEFPPNLLSDLPTPPPLPDDIERVLRDLRTAVQKGVWSLEDRLIRQFNQKAWKFWECSPEKTAADALEGVFQELQNVELAFRHRCPSAVIRVAGHFLAKAMSDRFDAAEGLLRENKPRKRRKQNV